MRIKKLNFKINRTRRFDKQDCKSRIDCGKVCRTESWAAEKIDGAFIGHAEVRYCIIGKTRPGEYEASKEILLPLVKIIMTSSQMYAVACENIRKVSLETKNTENAVNAAINLISKYNSGLQDGSLEGKLDINKQLLVREAGEVLKFLEQVKADPSNTSYSTRKLGLSNLVNAYKPKQ